jgi:arylsulfatase A-like enzyme
VRALVALLAFFLWPLFLAPTAMAGQEQKPRQPNIVFMLMDDLGWADLGCTGSKFYETPNIDRLAAKGMRFTCAYTACPVCSPTRNSIMTGKNPARLHVTNYLVGKRWPATSPLQPVAWSVKGLPASEITIASLLKRAGYATGIVGKWHVSAASPTTFGFDVSLVPGGGGYFKTSEYLTDAQSAAAVKFIETNKDRPFFLYLCHNAPHVPLQAKKELIAKYEAKGKALKPAGATFGKDNGVKVRQVQDHAVYAAMIESMDQSIGRVMKKLQDLGLEENTIVIFTSDNGGLCSAEGWPTSNLPLRLGKGWLYEGGVRVPFMVYWPGHTKAGSLCDTPIISDDYSPTLLEMAGLPPQPKLHLDGLSIAPLLKQTGQLERTTFHWHYPHYANQGGPPSGSIRHGDHKLIEFYETGRLELYDLKNDLGQRNDLAGKMPERTQELRRMLEAWRQSVGAQMPKRKS